MVIHFPFSFLLSFLLFFFNATATTEIYTLSLHDALPIYALLERRGARAALVTTAGFEDVLVIGRQARGSLYDLNWTRPAPLVEDRLRFGVRERVAADGSVVEELGDEEVAKLVRKLKRARL